MFSLQKLLGKDDRFFKLMEGSAEEARASIRGLAELLAAPEEKRSLNPIVGARRKEKRLAQELTEHLARTFVTPLEREDIQALAESLYKIPKVAEKFAEHFMFSGRHTGGLDLKRQMKMLEKAADTVVVL